MPHILRNLMGNTRFYASWKALGHYPDYYYWLLRGKPTRSPHLVKQRAVRQYGRKYGLKTLIETGTYYGEMIAAVLSDFDRIYSIELDPRLALLATNRFREYSHVTIIEGDSEKMIPELLAKINEPCLFWLDAGYYGWDDGVGNLGRLSSEMQAILADGRHIVLMDDAHFLNGKYGPLSIEQLRGLVAEQFPNRTVAVVDDILRIE